MSRQLSFACVPRCETSASAPTTKIRPTTAPINIFELIVWLFLAKTAASTLFSVEVSIETDSRQKRQDSFIRIENPHSEAHWAALCWEIYSVTQWCNERTCGESFFMPSLRRTLLFYRRHLLQDGERKNLTVLWAKRLAAGEGTLPRNISRIIVINYPPSRRSRNQLTLPDDTIARRRDMKA